jgi:mannose/fructose/N-acetylgalactosamine-specific phosphotransferase system component IIB
MIKLTRIDDRLVHGQVALVWTPALSVNCLIVANDKAASDEFLKMTLGFAKPANTKLLIKSLDETISFLNDPANGGLKILLIINSVQDALTLSESIPEITSVNFGGMRGKEGSRLVSKAIAITDEDIAISRKLIDKGVELEIRQVPTDKKQLLQDLI